MLRLLGGWDNRPDSLQAVAERFRRSVELMPSAEDTYGAWGVWRERDETALDLVPVDMGDPATLEPEIVRNTEQVNDGPMRQPGHHLAFARRSTINPESGRAFKYTVRAGFENRPEPYNNVFLEIAPDTLPELIGRCLSALVVAWEPDSLAVLTRETQRVQHRQSSDIIVGWLTFIRAGTPFNADALDESIVVREADGGVCVTIPRSPVEPSLAHVEQVRRALGYSPRLG